ncbi:hypothetical protein AXF42_Ash000417 [Apostasia shenzhenica]|uniref:Uncharacterized protein n=1 Tax=Apostasia shenzhenica TaxID=1088818 RepID=A0A2I0AGA4_9ASPA|nr:hypothetical protein AXF42_Ash000417 [Apostasia shenzhenica]
MKQNQNYETQFTEFIHSTPSTENRVKLDGKLKKATSYNRGKPRCLRRRDRGDPWGRHRKQGKQPRRIAGGCHSPRRRVQVKPFLGNRQLLCHRRFRRPGIRRPAERVGDQRGNGAEGVRRRAGIGFHSDGRDHGADHLQVLHAAPALVKLERRLPGPRRPRLRWQGGLRCGDSSAGEHLNDLLEGGAVGLDEGRRVTGARSPRSRGGRRVQSSAGGGAAAAAATAAAGNIHLMDPPKIRFWEL